MKITLYTNPGCTPCNAVRKHLERQGVEYDEIDMSTDEEAKSFVMSFGYVSAPVLIIKQHGKIIDHIDGFRPEEISAAIFADAHP